MSFRVADEDPAYPPRSISTCLNFIKTSVSKWDSRSTAITEATEGDGELSSFRHFCVTLNDSGMNVENSWWIIQRIVDSLFGSIPITYTVFYASLSPSSRTEKPSR